MRELAYAVRALRRTPGVSAASVLILGLGIGAATAMVSVFHASVVRRLPIPEQDRLVVLWPLGEGAIEVPFTPEQFATLSSDSRTLESIAGFAHWGNQEAAMSLEGNATSLRLAAVTPNWFTVMGASPVLGRFLQPEDVESGSVVVLGHGAWRRKFGGDSAIIGKQLEWRLVGVRYTVVGIAPPGLDFPVGTDLWAPVGPGWVIDGVGRLRPGASVASARAEVAALVTTTPRGFGSAITGAFARDLPGMVYGDVRPALLVMVSATVLLLLIACTNVGNLLLLKAADRTREIAVRRALGASPAEIFRQLAWESSVLGLLGGLAGIAIALLLLRMIVIFAPANLPRLDSLRLAGAPLVIGLAVTLATVFTTGLAPLIGTRRSGPDAPVLLGGGRTVTESLGRRRIRQLLVAGQVALAVIMLHGAALLTRSLARLETLDLGYDSGQLTFIQLIPPTSMGRPSQAWFPLLDRLLPAIRALPGVVGTSPLVAPPFTGSNTFTTALEAEGTPGAAGRTTPVVSFDGVGPEFFRAVDVRLIRGRGFVDADRAGTIPVAVVTSTIAKWLWPGEDPVGRRVRFAGDTGESTWRTVVGVAEDLHFREYRTSTPTIFLEAHQLDFWQGGLAVRTRGDPASAIREIRATIERVTPELGFLEARSMGELIGKPLARPRLHALLLGGFSSVALFLAAIGLSAVVAWSVRKRYRELGIRIALGAGPERLKRQVLHEALVPVWIGGATGVVLALIASQVLRGLLFEISPGDPIALGFAGAVLVAAGFAAGWFPARQATRIDPVRALQVE